MDKLFLTVLNMSLTGAFVIAAIILARLPLKKAPKVISYCLWAVAGFRLVFPFSIESFFSLLPFNAQTIPSDIATQAIPRIDSGIPYINNAVSSVLPAATPAASVNPLQIWMAVGAYVWLIGAAAMFLYGVISYALLKHRMRTAIRVEGNIYDTDNIQSPFVLGIIKPKIYLPLSLTSGEREYIILHEQTHIRRCDHIIKFAAYFILCLHWFNPLAWAAFLLMGVDMEMSCDERVLKEMGGDTKHDYSRSLLSLATQRRVIGGSPLAFGEGGVKERVKNVLNFKNPSRVIIVAAVALVAVLSIGFAMNRADEIDLPIAGDVYSITMNQYNEQIPIGEVTITDRHEINQLLNTLSSATKTWRTSVNDYPTNNNYLIVRLHMANEMRTLCLYTEGEEYIEEPYIGVYRPKTKFNFAYSMYNAYLNGQRKTADTVSIIVWKDTDNKTRYSLFDGDETPAPSELSSGKVFNDIAELNAALAIYPKDTLGMAHVYHTMDFTKEEMISITEQFVIPSGNYSMPTGLYEFHLRTLDEAREIVGEHYPGWPDITFVGEDTISYTNPPKPVEVYKFEVVVSGLIETCAVSKERGIFFNYSDNTWWAYTGLAESSGATRNMTLDDVRAIAEKIGIDLTLGDLRDFIGEDIGSGLQAMQYHIEDAPYMLVVGAGSGVPVIYANLIHTIPGGSNESIDIRYYDVDKFIKDETKELIRPLPEPQETTPPHDPGYYTDPVQALKAELEADGCVILNVFAIDWTTRQYALDGKEYEFVQIYAEYLDGPYSDTIYVMDYAMRRPADDNTAEWKHDEPVFWEGIAYGVAKYAAEQYYAETGRTNRITDMRPISIDDNSAYVPGDKRSWHTVVFNVGYENDPKSHPQQIAVLISQDGQSRWQVAYWSGIKPLE